jgi:hypothetical protein
MVANQISIGMYTQFDGLIMYAQDYGSINAHNGVFEIKCHQPQSIAAVFCKRPGFK